jgi:hypothetical protein
MIDAYYRRRGLESSGVPRASTVRRLALEGLGSASHDDQPMVTSPWQ